MGDSTEKRRDEEGLNPISRGLYSVRKRGYDRRARNRAHTRGPETRVSRAGLHAVVRGQPHDSRLRDWRPLRPRLWPDGVPIHPCPDTWKRPRRTHVGSISRDGAKTRIPSDALFEELVWEAG